jgi:hypothetical protein
MQVTLAADVIVHASCGVHVPGAVGVFDEAGGDSYGGGDSVSFCIQSSQICAQTAQAI